MLFCVVFFLFFCVFLANLVFFVFCFVFFVFFPLIFWIFFAKKIADEKKKFVLAPIIPQDEISFKHFSFKNVIQAFVWSTDFYPE